MADLLSVESGDLAKVQVEGLGSSTPQTRRLDLSIELLGHFQARKSQFQVSSRLDRNSQILHEMLHEKSGFEIFRQNSGDQIGEGPTPSRSGGDGFQHPSRVQPRRLGEPNRLAGPQHRRGHEDLIHDLGLLPGPRTTLQNDGRSHGLEPGTNFFVGGGLAPHHDGKGSVSGPHVTPRDRGIKGHHRSRPRLFVDPDRQTRVTGGHIDQKTRRLSRAQGPDGSQMDRFNVSGVPHDREHTVRAVCRLTR